MKQQKNGKYVKYVTIIEYGKKKRKYFSADSEEELYFKIFQYKQNMNKSKLFKEVAEDWKNEFYPTYAPRTLSCYTAPLNRCIKYFDGRYIDDIEPIDIKNYMSFLKMKKYAKKSIKNHRVVLSMIFKFAIINGNVKYNPVSDVPIPRNLSETHRLPPGEYELEKIKASLNCTFGLFYIFILYTGLRRGEALAITYEDIDYEKNTITVNKSLYHEHNQPHIKKPKTVAGNRIVPLLQPLKAVLPKKDKGVIFSNEKGEYLTASNVETLIKYYRRETGVTATPHQLRHQYAVILHNANVLDKDAQDLLGHANLSTTKDIYTHITDKRRKISSEKIEKYLADES